MNCGGGSSVDQEPITTHHNAEAAAGQGLVAWRLCCLGACVAEVLRVELLVNANAVQLALQYRCIKDGCGVAQCFGLCVSVFGVLVSTTWQTSSVPFLLSRFLHRTVDRSIMASYDRDQVTMEDAKNETVAIEKIGSDSVPEMDEDQKKLERKTT